jgi:hypothetical protein
VPCDTHVWPYLHTISTAASELPLAGGPADSRGTAAAPKLGGVAIRLTASATGGSAMPMRGTPGAGIPSTRQPSAQPDLFSGFNPFDNGE